MFIPKISLLHSKKAAQKERLPKYFGVLSWNVYKKTLNKKFQPLIHRLLHENPADVVLLQEAKVQKDFVQSLIPGYSYVCAPNIETKKNYFGVLNLCDVKSLESGRILSSVKEPLLKTHKSTLINLHKLSNDQTLLVANIHAINFLTNKHYANELNILFDILLKHNGPMIIAGDFNNWNLTRTRILQRLTDGLKLHPVAMNSYHQSQIKSFLSYQIDHIFYRDLHLIEAKTLNTGRFSDHIPIYAKFGVK